jgi:transposase, IS5 family
VVDFEMFRPDLVAALNYSNGTKGGRPPFDPVLMFKVLVIQAQNNLSDDRAEFLINDRLSFMRFLGLGLGDRVPASKTIWVFRERLTKAGAVEALFARFDSAIREAGYIPMSGQIVDASLVSAPKQRNTDGEKKAIKEGRMPQTGRRSPRSSARRTATRAGRWSSARRGSARTAPGTPISRSSATRAMPASTAGTASSGSGT